MRPLIELENVSKIYSAGGEPVSALSGVSLTIESGEWAAVTGRSGSGKSTLMNILGCLDTPTSGRYLLRGEDVSAMPESRLSRVRNREIGFIFQGFNLIPDLTALENVELALRDRGGLTRSEVRRRAAAALEQVGLAERREHRPGQLSGGQQQRVAIARAIAAEPPLILADEPTGNLDTASGAQVMEILRGLWGEGRTVVLITHDPAIAASARRVLTIADGKLL